MDAAHKPQLDWWLHERTRARQRLKLRKHEQMTRQQGSVDSRAIEEQQATGKK
jgi:hypothetical protein